ncbi:SpoIIE family protein phosphatase [Cerasicoccus frondis]|uniref:SpoIIE family protein phosphatase n=1 Tax=Cerasicoccus frondis TaxID=490090 RepID=UPI002852A026|nr:SpoIIE family protein phosphatase [Cerasicoccus frondis]
MPPVQQSESISLQRHRLPANIVFLPAVRAQFMAFLESLDLPPAELSGWKLTFTELLTNAILHGAQSDAHKEVAVEWSLNAGSIVLGVQDPGPGPGTTHSGAAALPADLNQEHGRGRYLVHSFVDSFQEWRGAPQGYRIEVSKLSLAGEGLAPPSAEMEAVLAELSASYEGLAAFYQLSESLVLSHSLNNFLSQSLPNVRDSIDLDYLRLYVDSSVPAFIKDQLNDVHEAVMGEDISPALRQLLEPKTELVWEDETQRQALGADIPPLSELSSGCLLPVTSDAKFFGMLAAGRRDRHKRIASSQVNNLRTFADIFGISIGNYISTTIRREAEKDLREFEIAAEIQQHLLPVRQPKHPLKREVRIFQRVAQNVAGDFAEYCLDRLGNHYVTIIDVMGKGVSAALLGIIYRAAFNLMLDNPMPLPVMLQRIGRILNHMLGDLTMFITVTILRWSDEVDMIEHVNAGHCPTIRISQTGEITEFEPSGPPIGLLANFTYTSDQIPMQPGDRIALVSDGCYEWRCESKLFGWDNLINLIKCGNHEHGAGLWSDLAKLMDRECCRDEPSDDITLVYIK